MRNRAGNVIWGLIFIILGIGFGGNAFDLWNFEVFFDGWWTLFLIIPCIISIVQSGMNTGNMTGLIIGGLLLMSAQDMIQGVSVGELIIPVVLIMIGFNFLFKGRDVKKKHQTMYSDGRVTDDVMALFGGRKVNYKGKEFPGANMTAIFGGINLDIRDAVFTEDAVIQVTSIFGGVDIYVPVDVEVKVNSLPILGGVSKKISEPVTKRATIYVNATTVLGGVDIRNS